MREPATLSSAAWRRRQGRGASIRACADALGVRHDEGPEIPHDTAERATPRIDMSEATAVGGWYMHSRSAHRNPKVIEAYKQLQAETDHLYAHLTRDACPWTTRVVFTRCRRPYESDHELISAVRANGTLEMTSAAAAGERLHPLLDCELGGGFDRFRAVHDLIGHARFGYGFGLVDEYAAWTVQDRLHGGLARAALATELYGVNAARNVSGEAPELRALLLIPSATL